MITIHGLTAIERSQLERKELARGAWRDGEVQNALLILESVTQEEMTPRVAGEVFVTEAAFRCAVKDFSGALESLERAAPFLDACDSRVHGSFYFHRALAYRNTGNVQSALIDYSGSIAFWQECADKDYEIAALNNLAELYLMENDLEQAGHYSDRVFALLSDTSIHACNAYDTRAKLFLAEGKLVLAWEAIVRAISLAGSNDQWLNGCLETQDKIKQRLFCFIVPFTTIRDLEVLKVAVVRHALEVTKGSIVEAAKRLGTSHQVVAYTAQQNGLTRRPPRKKSIIKSLS